MQLSYLDFELEIGIGQGRDFPLVVRSPAGEARTVMRFPYDELALESCLRDLQIALLRSGGDRRQVLSPEQQAVRSFGQALFDALFSGEVRSRFDVSLQQARNQGKGLRIRLQAQSPAAAALPWEYLYDPRQSEYCALSVETPVVRFLELPQPITPLAVTPPLRMLGMVASPADLPGLDVDQEKQRIEQALTGLLANGRLELEWLTGQTWRDLQEALRRGPWHIFHFSGHGRFNALTDEGQLIFADDLGRARAMPASNVGRLLANHRTLRLAWLNACEGARGGEADIFSSTASILVRRDIPAVVAMQHEITDRAAIELARTFYGALANGYPVDAALAEARVATSLAVNNTVEWGTPVLYMRAPDGMLFELDAAASPVQRAPLKGEASPPMRPTQATVTTLRFASMSKVRDVLLITDPLQLELVRVPAGEFLMGSDPSKDKDSRDNEMPQHPVHLNEYFIGKYPVTNAQYGVFVKATKREVPSHWENGAIPNGKEKHPVVNVTWPDAVAFCQWLEKATGMPFRLPSEADWEKAASWDERAQHKRIWPWGDVWQEVFAEIFGVVPCNSAESDKGNTTAVSTVSVFNKSACGACEMSGNVWEWCSTKWREDYSGSPDDDLAGGARRVLRGGSFNHTAIEVRCAVRVEGDPNSRYGDVGFRVVLASS